VADQPNPEEDDREQLYRDVWGAEIAPPRREANGPRDDDAEIPGDPYLGQDRRAWEPGGRLRALELEVRELRTAVQALQRSTKGSVGALRSSIRQLIKALGFEPDEGPRQAVEPPPPTPINPDRPAGLQ
jgi:hypothetical protein